MSIGQSYPAEWSRRTDPRTRRRLVQYTSAPHYSYPLYYFIPSITAQGDKLVFYSERSGWVQLYAMDLASGDFVQLSDGRTRDSGWAIWSEHHVRGIYNHLAALNRVRREVYYFQDAEDEPGCMELRCTHLDTLANRAICRLPGRISIGQSAFSPDGRWFAFIHAEHRLFKQAVADWEALKNMKFPVDGEHLTAWRNRVPTVIGLLDTESGSYRDVMRLDYHVHHVLWLNNGRLLVNHVKNDLGIWAVNLDGSGYQHLRPRNPRGAVCHQVISEKAIFYETYSTVEKKTSTYFGRYDLSTGAYREFPLPGWGYGHTGSDPAGRLLFYEFHGQASAGTDGHGIFLVCSVPKDGPAQVEILRDLPPAPGGQREHAHPFLSPDRQWMFFTEMVDGIAQILALDVADLTAAEALSEDLFRNPPSTHSSLCVEAPGDCART